MPNKQINKVKLLTHSYDIDKKVNIIIMSCYKRWVITIDYKIVGKGKHKQQDFTATNNPVHIQWSNGAAEGDDACEWICLCHYGLVH